MNKIQLTSLAGAFIVLLTGMIIFGGIGILSAWANLDACQAEIELIKKRSIEGTSNANH